MILDGHDGIHLDAENDEREAWIHICHLLIAILPKLTADHINSSLSFFLLCSLFFCWALLWNLSLFCLFHITTQPPLIDRPHLIAVTVWYKHIKLPWYWGSFSPKYFRDFIKFQLFLVNLKYRIYYSFGTNENIKLGRLKITIFVYFCMHKLACDSSN